MDRLVPRTIAGHVAWAVALTILAMGARSLLTPLLGARVPFVFAFPAIACAAALLRPATGILVAVLSAVWAFVPLLPPDLGEGALLEVMLFLPAAILTSTLVGWARAGSQTPADASGAESRLALRWLQLTFFGAIAIPTAFFALAASGSYRNAMEQAWTRVDRAARIAQAHAGRVIETNEALRKHALRILGGRDDASLRAAEATIHVELAEMVSDLPQVQSVWIWNAAGAPIAGNRRYPVPTDLNVADREYFRWHREGRGGVFITEPLTSRATGETFFDFSYPRSTRGGAFAGVISISLYPAYFTRFYADLARDEPGLIVTLARPDGAVVTRWPERPPGVSRLSPSSPWVAQMREGRMEGRLELVSSLDGERRLVAYRRMQGYPLYASAGLARSVVLAGWYRETALLAAFTFPLAFALAFIARIALRRTERELAASRALQREAEARLHTEEALRQAQKLEALGRLTGGVAHDFNNLLMVVNNNLRIHELRRPEVADAPELSAIGRAVTTGQNLTRKLLAFSRRQPQQAQVISLAERVPALLPLLTPLVGSSVRIALDVAVEDAHVEVDPAELELAVINLALNARDAMPHGGRLLLALGEAGRDEVATLPEGRYVRLSVRDTGTGMSDEVKRHLFEPFFTTKPVGQGTGLGLSQVYGMCSRARGAVKVDSRLGEGTEVRLYLRKVPAPSPPAAVAVTPGDDARRLRILLVEDNPDLGPATCGLLQAMQAQVVLVTSGEAALGRLDHDAERFDVVLSDIVMPGAINGLELARTLAARPDAPPVVLMTGYSDRLNEAESLRYEVVAKPCPPEQLLAAIRRVVARHVA